jgi:phage-related minor tail protein
MAEGKHLALFGQAINVLSAIPWLIAAVCLVAGGIWLAAESRTFRRVWSSLMESARQA